ncbi:MAG: Mu transposase C-terminal domain-containing protein [Gallionella sp.]|nr:Mu transposase C-terminal domain-containing protein [Gallionella sp.]
MHNGQFSLLPGSTVKFKDKQYVILDIAGLDAVIAKDMVSGKSERLPVSQLEPDVIPTSPKARQDLLCINDDDWMEARKRFEIIRPLLEMGIGQKTAEQVRLVATDNGVNAATIYRWIKSFQETGLVSSLIRASRKDAGGTRLDHKVEEVIKEFINKYFLSLERSSPTDVWDDIKARCMDLKLPVPHQNTIRNRISLLSEETKLEKRMGKKAAKEKFTPLKGSFPGADYPLAVVQIDHTPMDLILVEDDEFRKPIGKPNLTLAIDVFSKMVTGYYIGLDPVGALSTGLCLSHSILPKDNWLSAMEIATPWPVWGKMRVVHTDNAKEFRGTMMGKACEEHGIVLEQRPRGQPQYGGHIERSFRTYMAKVHTIQGTTRSNVQDKGDYNAEGKACMTISALEKWFAIFIVEYYHQKEHAGNNGVPPITMYERGILGTPDTPGVGLPMRIADETRLKIDFLPYEMRTVQEYGVVNEYIYYYHDALRRWMHSPDPKNPKKKQLFICRYDPRNLSTIYFYEPDTKNYIYVPYKDISRPPISIWELRAAKKHLAEENQVTINEELIFGAVKKMRAIVESEAGKTSKARRQAARAKGWAKSKDHIPAAKESLLPGKAPDEDIFSEPVTPFDDIGEAS